LIGWVKQERFFKVVRCWSSINDKT